MKSFLPLSSANVSIGSTSLPVRKPGQSAREDYEYERLGKANLFLSVEPLAGKHRVQVTQRHMGGDFAQELRRLLTQDYPEAGKVVLVYDNLSTHTPACLYATFPAEEAHRLANKIEWHYTPEHGSWLNMAECELSVLARQCLKRRIKDIETLTQEAAAWEAQRNALAVQIHWCFTTAAHASSCDVCIRSSIRCQQAPTRAIWYSRYRR